MKRVAFDFDGVIHSYEGGWQGYDVIAGDLVPGVKEAMMRLKGMGYEIAIISSRALTPEGLKAIRTWLSNRGIDPDLDVDMITAQKQPAMVYLDDRAVTFVPGMDIVATVEGFTPWMMDRPIRSAYE